MFLESGDILLEVLATLFNSILSGPAEPPETWRRSVIKVLHTSGDGRLPKKYRSISITPMLYNLFSSLLYNRGSVLLEPQQSADQAGFRNRF